MLPWENFGKYKRLRDALFEEHQPIGPTESLLVEEIAVIYWRKRRLHPAERQVFEETMSRKSKLQAHAEELQQKFSEGAAAHPDDEEFQGLARSANFLREFLSSPSGTVQMLQASAEEGFDATRLENLARYEAHLDRKLQRVLFLLLGAEAGEKFQEFEEHRV
jgi:hypothetical protein